MIRKHVLLVHTGGTLGMAEPDRRRLDLAPAAHLQRLLSRVPELQEIADIDLVAPWNLDSSDVGPEQWQRLAQIVAGAFQGASRRVDGVVIIHGTDTMAYTASALAYMLRGLDRPVVLTGSQRPLEAWRTDARANLAAAVETATRPLPEVVIVFGDKVLRGCRASKVDARIYQAFDSPNEAPLGRIGVSLDLDVARLRSPGALQLDDALGTGLMALTVFPGMDQSLLQGVAHAAQVGLKAVLVRAFGTGNVPMTGSASLLPMAEKLAALGLDVIVATQCPGGSAELDLYASGRALLAAGAISAGDMTFEAAATKALWALGHPQRSMRHWFATDLAGEITL